MKTIVGRSVVSLMLVAAALCALTVRSASADFRNVTIAVADITRIFDSYEKREYYQAEMDRRRESIAQRERRLDERIRALENQMNMLSMGHPQRQEVRRNLDAAQEEYMRFQREAAREMDDLLRAGRSVIYGDILNAIERFARENNIDLVIKQQTFTREQPTAGDLSKRIAERNVLYSNPRLDITEEIADMLNDEYRAARAREEAGAGRADDQ